MRAPIAVGVAALFLAGCTGGEDPVFVDPVLTGSRGNWAGEINRNRPGRVVGRPTDDPALAQRIEVAVTASGAIVSDMTVFDFGRDELAPALRLQSDNVASYMKHDLGALLEEMRERKYWLLELYDEDGRFAFATGSTGPGGTLSVRLGLE